MTDSQSVTFINLHITGFGPFLNVVKNPSSTIMNLVADHFRAKLEENNNNDTEGEQRPKILVIQVASTTELEVSVQRVEQYIGEMMAAVSQNHKNITSSSRTINFFLHFGINRGATKTIAVETEAENCVLIPPDDHSKFPDYYCAEISHKKGTTPKNSEDDGNNKELENSDTSDDDDDDEGEFKADSVSADDAKIAEQKKSAGKTKRPVSCLFPTKLRKITQELLTASSTSLSQPVKNRLFSTEAAQIANSTADERNVLSVPEFYNLAPSLDAGKYLCNFIFYLSLFKLSLQNATEGFRAMKMKHSSKRKLKYFSDLKKQTPAFLNVYGKNTTLETNVVVGEEDTKNDENHSLFIHVLDPSRVTEKDQSDLICSFLEKLFDRL